MHQSIQACPSPLPPGIRGAHLTFSCQQYQRLDFLHKVPILIFSVAAVSQNYWKCLPDQWVVRDELWENRNQRDIPPFCHVCIAAVREIMLWLAFSVLYVKKNLDQKHPANLDLHIVYIDAIQIYGLLEKLKYCSRVVGMVREVVAHVS